MLSVIRTLPNIHHKRNLFCLIEIRDLLDSNHSSIQLGGTLIIDLRQLEVFHISGRNQEVCS